MVSVVLQQGGNRRRRCRSCPLMSPHNSKCKKTFPSRKLVFLTHPMHMGILIGTLNYYDALKWKSLQLVVVIDCENDLKRFEIENLL